MLSNSFDCLIKTVRLVRYIWHLFHSWENWGLEMLNGVSMITYDGKGRSGDQVLHHQGPYSCNNTSCCFPRKVKHNRQSGKHAVHTVSATRHAGPLWAVLRRRALAETKHFQPEETFHWVTSFEINHFLQSGGESGKFSCCQKWYHFDWRMILSALFVCF